MFEREVKMNQFLLGYIGRLVEPMTDAELTQRPPQGGHPPLWILGHLAVSSEGAARMLGLESMFPPEWRTLFGPGSSDDVAQSERFTKQAMVEAVQVGYRRLHDPAMRATQEQLDGPHGMAFFEKTPLQSMGDVLGLLLTVHFAIHTGQLSYWARLQGRQPLF
jgi:hypothetical protein